MSENICTGVSPQNTAAGCNKGKSPIIALGFAKTRTASEFVNVAAGKLIAAWTAKINDSEANRMFIIKFQKQELADNESVIEELSGNNFAEVMVKSGMDKFYINGVSTEFLARLKTFTNEEYYMYRFYSDNTFEGVSETPVTSQTSASKVQGERVKIVIGQQKEKTGTEAQKAVINVKSQEPEYAISNGMTVNLNIGTSDFHVGELEGIMNTVLTVSGNSVTVTDLKGAGVEGLVAADFYAKKVSDGSVITLTCVPNTVTPYIYALTGYAGAALLLLKNQPNMTLKGYEYKGAAVAITLLA